MGSGALLAALVVLWVVVLVPMVVTRGDSQTARGELTSTGRPLQRRRAGAPPGLPLRRRRAAAPATWVGAERVAVGRDALRTSGELKIDVHKLRRRALGG